VHPESNSEAATTSCSAVVEELAKRFLDQVLQAEAAVEEHLQDSEIRIVVLVVVAVQVVELLRNR
jgi:hypothetical protein